MRTLASPLDSVYSLRSTYFTVRTSKIRNHALFGHGPGAFNAWEATARQLIGNPDIAPEETVLAEFSRRFRPANLAELLFEDPVAQLPRDSKLFSLSLNEYMSVMPWSEDLKMWPKSSVPELRLTSYGPLSSRILQLEVWRLKRLVRSITLSGYQVDADSSAGYFVSLGDDYRFMIAGGFHRAAVAAALGLDEIPVRLVTNAVTLITLDQLPLWPLVRKGVFDSTSAELILRKLFDDGGAKIAIRLGLQPHSASPASCEPMALVEVVGWDARV